MLPFVTILGRSLPMYGLLGLLGFLLGLLFVILRVPRFSLSRDDAAYIYVFAALGAPRRGQAALPAHRAAPGLAELVRSGSGRRALLAYVSGRLRVPRRRARRGSGRHGLSARAYRVRLADFMPLLVPALALVAALGASAASGAGCCYGVECVSPVSVVFPETSLAAPPGVPRLPVQLFEAAVQLALFLALLWFTARPRRRALPRSLPRVLLPRALPARVLPRRRCPRRALGALHLAVALGGRISGGFFILFYALGAQNARLISNWRCDIIVGNVSRDHQGKRGTVFR